MHPPTGGNLTEEIQNPGPKVRLHQELQAGYTIGKLKSEEPGKGLVTSQAGGGVSPSPLLFLSFFY
jgi:hypothetical protein